ncbi:MAG: SpoIID/LytB domain-containing protein [Bacillota bacterium]
MTLKTRNQNLILIGIVLALIIGGVIFAFKMANHQIALAYHYNLNQLVDKAEQNFYQGDYQKSIELYHQILDQDQTNTAAYKNLATVYETLGEYRPAIEQYQQVLKIKPQQGLIYYQLGRLYSKLDQNQQAVQELKQALLQIEDQSVLKLVHLDLAEVYYQQEKYNLALDAAQQALELDSNLAVGYYYLGLIKEQQGAREEAIEHYQQVLDKDRSFVEVQLRLADNYFGLGQYQQAKEQYEKVLDRNKDFHIVQSRLEQIKELRPQLFETVEDEQQSQDQQRQELLEREVEFAQLKPIVRRDELPQLRIGLAEGRQYLAFRVAKDFLIKDQQDEVIFKGQARQPYQLQVSDSGAVKLLDQAGNLEEEFTESFTIVSQEESEPILLHNINYGQGYYWAGKEDRQYRGAIEIRPADKEFNVINLVSMAGYLYSVVPSEMSAAWPLEALKVQSVAARSYTLHNLGKHSYESYDLCATVHCAAYGGVTKEQLSTTQAVDETRGEILTYDGEPINAVYSANSGGRTESSAEVWGGQVPYLQGVTTLKEATNQSNFPLAPYQLQRWMREQPHSYSQQLTYGHPNRYRWQRIIPAQEIAAKLDIGAVKRLVPQARAKGGTVEAVKVVGTTGEEVIKRGLRSFFGGLRSSRFIIRTEYGANNRPDRFIFYGSGWGHNIGMDQIAAANMADADWNYQQILLHFYTGVELVDRY